MSIIFLDKVLAYLEMKNIEKNFFELKFFNHKMNKFKLFFSFLYLINLKCINTKSESNFDLDARNENQTHSLNQLLYQKRHDKSIIFLNYNWIVFKEKVQKCRMFIDSCEFQVLIKKSIKTNEFNVTSADESTFKIVSVEQCDDKANSSDCNSIVEYFKEGEMGVNVTEFNVYNIIYQPVLIGFTSFNFKLQSSELILFDVIITEPRRFLDYAFDIFIRLFGVVISTLMGVLLDKKAILEIAKMPIPVVIGFCCQYICMPLV